MRKIIGRGGKESGKNPGIVDLSWKGLYIYIIRFQMNMGRQKKVSKT